MINSGHDTVTVQDLGKKGIKNSELMELARRERRILISYDKDFIYFKHGRQHFLVVISIHPLIDENVLPVFEELIGSLNVKVLEEKLLLLEKEGPVFREKN
ncbi:MAG: DUF5615 family PIN-like protein [Candidatus Lokiarchaeota archaeon]|nr:DUF5615 family PIN-like protein [Candidatus Lokiarchaeota archaeon]